MEIKKIFVHCSATMPNMDIGVKEIREWHVEERGWSDIGYHYVIRRDGTIETGRPATSQGAHAYGYNKNSLGICVVGGLDKRGNPDANFTFAQYESLVILLEQMFYKYNLEEKDVYGHRDITKTKACPCFDIHELIRHT